MQLAHACACSSISILRSLARMHDSMRKQIMKTDHANRRPQDSNQCERDACNFSTSEFKAYKFSGIKRESVGWQGLLATDSAAVEYAELLKLVCKVFWSTTYMGIPPLLLQEAQFTGWMTCLLQAVQRPVPRVSPSGVGHTFQHHCDSSSIHSQVFSRADSCLCTPLYILENGSRTHFRYSAERLRVVHTS